MALLFPSCFRLPTETVSFAPQWGERSSSMFKSARSGCLVFLGLLAGCGGGAPSTSYSGPPPPHQGSLITIPGSRGYVEVVKKEVSGKSPVSAEVSFYFLKNDAATPYSPSPGAGTLAVGKKKVNLKAEGDGLVTPNGPPLFPKGGVDGWLIVDLGGKSINIPLGLR
jgi:hypothetical protein